MACYILLTYAPKNTEIIKREKYAITIIENKAEVNLKMDLTLFSTADMEVKAESFLLHQPHNEIQINITKGIRNNASIPSIGIYITPTSESISR